MNKLERLTNKQSLKLSKFTQKNENEFNSTYKNFKKIYNNFKTDSIIINTSFESFVNEYRDELFNHINNTYNNYDSLKPIIEKGIRLAKLNINFNGDKNDYKESLKRIEEKLMNNIKNIHQEYQETKKTISSSILENKTDSELKDFEFTLLKLITFNKIQEQ